MTIYDFHPRIEENPIFKNTDPSIVNRFLTESVMTVSAFAPNETAYSSCTSNVRVGILLEGVAQVYTDHARAEERTLLRTMGPSDTFGIANLYAEDEPFPTRIVALTPCRILFIEAVAFQSFLENDPVALKNYLRLQSKKLVYLNRKIAIFTAGSAEKRLAVFLLDHEIDGVFTPPCSMSQLAELLGIGRASLYRAIDSLAGCGLIEKEGKRLLIRNKNDLLRFI